MKTHRFNLVLPESLMKRINNLARWNRRSATQEMVVAIEFYLEHHSDWIDAPDRKQPPQDKIANG